MKIVYRCILTYLLIILIVPINIFAAAPSKIVGANIDNSPAVLPSGVCAGTITLTDGGVFDTGGLASVSMSVGAAPRESPNYGGVYADFTVLGTGTWQYTLLQNPFVLNTNILINAGNAPDSPALSNGAAFYYNFDTSRWVAAGRRTVDGALHIREYLDGGLTLDGFPGPILAGGTGVVVEPAYSNDRSWHILTVAAGLTLFELLNEVSVASVFIPGGGSYSGIVLDDNFIYATQQSGNQIYRWSRADITTGVSSVGPGYPSGGTFIEPMTADNALGVLYVPLRGNGITDNVLYRVRTSDMTVTGFIALGVGNFIGKTYVDTANNKLYVLTSAGGTNPAHVVRLNRTTLAIEQSFNGTTTTSEGPTTSGQSGFDMYHQKIYIGMPDVTSAKVQKVSTCS